MMLSEARASTRRAFANPHSQRLTRTYSDGTKPPRRSRPYPRVAIAPSRRGAPCRRNARLTPLELFKVDAFERAELNVS